MINSQSNGGVLIGLQYLRFVAALLVVLCHAWQMVPVIGQGDIGSRFEGGAAGVDLFFVISGFIMGYITAQRPVAPSRFMFDRIARIAPPYWAITLLMALVLIFAPSVFRSASFDQATLITSLLFIPWPSKAVPGAAPLLQIGWTLNYEMFFYAIFAISMWISPKRRREIACLIILAFASMQLFWPNRSNDFFQFYSSTIMIEFIYGMAIGLFVDKLKLSNAFIASSLAFSALLFAYAISYEIGRLHQARFLIWGIPSALVVASVISADLKGVVPVRKLPLLLGNSSYALYLTHLFALGGVRKIWPMMPGVIRGSDVFLILAAVAVSLAVGIGFYQFVEKPLVRLAKSAVADATRRKTKVAATLTGGANGPTGEA